jgi:hypothetical protein
MANWDDDDFEFNAPTVPIVATKGKWDGEDEDDGNVPVYLPFGRGSTDRDNRMNGTRSQKRKTPRPQ